MIRVLPSFRRALLRRCLPAVVSSALAVMMLTGCAGQSRNVAQGSNGYRVYFSANRSVDHTAILSASVSVVLGSEAIVKTGSKIPAENQPALPAFLVRLQRTKKPGVYELVTQAAVREAIRNKKGKLKVSKRYIGALVPTRPGETQIVSTDSDPIHLEARLERR